jgi:hypothetical protein
VGGDDEERQAKPVHPERVAANHPDTGRDREGGDNKERQGEAAEVANFAVPN